MTQGIMLLISTLSSMAFSPMSLELLTAIEKDELCLYPKVNGIALSNRKYLLMMVLSLSETDTGSPLGSLNKDIALL